MLSNRELDDLRPPPRKHQSNSALSGALDWVLLFDLEDSLVFPPKIALTVLRPDGVLYLEKLKTVLLLELTVPIEDRVLTAQSLKSKCYEGFIRECQSNGWKASLLIIKIGCRGYVSDSFKYNILAKAIWFI